MDLDALIAAALAPYVPFLSASDLAWMADELRAHAVSVFASEDAAISSRSRASIADANGSPAS